METQKILDGHFRYDALTPLMQSGDGIRHYLHQLGKCYF